MNYFIKLTRGFVATVDECDAYHWNVIYDPSKRRTAYAKRNGVAGKVTRLHRLIAERMGLDIVGKSVDHVNGNGLDNRRENLRSATHFENQRNRPAHQGSTSGFKGVNLDKRNRKWHARISSYNGRVSLGLFSNAIDAAIAYDRAALELHGEFAWVNFPINKNALAAVPTNLDGRENSADMVLIGTDT